MISAKAAWRPPSVNAASSPSEQPASLVELGGLVGTKQLPHREDMGERLLQFAHCLVRPVDGRSHLRAVAVLGLMASAKRALPARSSRGCGNSS